MERITERACGGKRRLGTTIPPGETPNIVKAPICRPLGDSGILVELGVTIDEELVARSQLLSNILRHALGRDALDVVPAYGSVLVRFDPLTTSATRQLELVAGALGSEAVKLVQSIDNDRRPRRQITVGVCFGGQYGLDFEQTAHDLGMREHRMRGLICQAEYRVAFLGFLTGFPYLLGLVDALAGAARRNSPRPRVQAGSVAIAAGQCGVYPRSASGGWRLLGRTAATLFDPSGDPATLFMPGDAVRFEAVERFDEAIAVIA